MVFKDRLLIVRARGRTSVVMLRVFVVHLAQCSVGHTHPPAVELLRMADPVRVLVIVLEFLSFFFSDFPKG